MEDFPLGQRLRRTRRAKDLTQQALGRLAGVNPITISRLESGDAQHAYARTVRDLAKALEVTSDYLLGLSNDPDMSRTAAEDRELLDAAHAPASPQPHPTSQRRKAKAKE